MCAPDVAMAATAQFTVQQVLEAGRRAEAEGRRDYAIQFYRHVIAHHNATPEAAEAYGAMRRLDAHEHEKTATVPLGQQRPTGQAPHTHVNGTGQPAHAQTLGYRPQLASPGPVALQAAHGRGEPHAPPTRPTQQRAGNDPSRAVPSAKNSNQDQAPDGDTTVPATKVAAEYRLGRWIAKLFGLAGGAGAIAGVVALGANLVVWQVKSPGPVVVGLASSPLLAASLILAASVLILFSQLARAMFDMAQSARPRTTPTTSEDAN